MKHFLFSLFIGLLSVVQMHAATRTFVYDDTKTEKENGTALQAAIDAAIAGDEIKVQAGTFYGNFTMKEGVNVSGGWNADFTAQTDYATILDAQANGRVLHQPAFSTLTVWSNFTIQNGNLKEKATDQLGSGVALNKKGQVKHCLIQNNTFSYSDNCLGGGVGNDATDKNTDVQVDDCIIKNNKASHGGGVRVRGTVINSIIENNLTEANAAGGVHLQAGRLVNSIVRGNTGKSTGGVRAYGKCDVINNLIYNNTASTSVGGLSIESALSNVIGNTIVCNNQETGTGSQAGVKIDGSKKDGSEEFKLNPNGTFFVNNVVWGNMSNGTVESQQVYYISRYDKSAGQRSYNAIMGQLGDDSAVTSIKLTEDNPGFADPTNGDFSLLETSPLIDFGNQGKVSVAQDLAGNSRVVNTTVDLGCYEYPVASTDAYVLVGEDLQAKINNTAKGYTVYVQAGTFFGNFTMKDGVNVSGGWNADFTAQTDYATILDAQANGRVLNQKDDFTTLTVWSNFTIQNGKLTTAMTDTGGAGVWLCKKGQVKHCLIQNNTYTYSGNCLGGGVGNNAADKNTDVQVDDCIIKNNKASHGGGVRVRGTVINSIIENNLTEANPAGGVHLQGGRLVNSIVRANTGKETGGVRAYGKCDVINNLIYNNTANGSIGGLSIESALSNVIGNTIVCNNQLTGTGSQAGVKIDNGKDSNGDFKLNPNGTFFVNNVVWGNMSNGTVESQQVYYISRYDKSAGQRSYNAIMGQSSDDSAVTSIKLTEDNPGFADPANGDFSLLETSPLIDFGNKDKVSVAQDLAGNNRIVNTTVDLGCYEYPVASTDAYVLVGEDLQAKINNTAKGYTVYVQAGTFYGNFTMKDGVNVSGGWNADFTAQTDHATILDAQANGRVLHQPADFTTLTVWSNLTIQNGKFTAQHSDKGGAGVWLCKKGQVKHCLIQNNIADITEGEANGGGVSNNGYTDDVLVDDCIIKNNKATHGGGARVCGVIINSIIENNSTINKAAGGVQLHYGGAMYNSIIRNNISGGDTGGVRMSGSKGGVLANCLIYGNTATGTIGGVALEMNGEPTVYHKVINNTIVGNEQKSTDNPNWCGVRLNVGGPLQFCNNIVWGNKVNGVVQDNQILVSKSYVSQTNNFVHNAVAWNGKLSDKTTDFAGVNTILLTTADPGFVDAINGDYQLAGTSKLINAGHSGYFCGTTDLAGNTRKQGNIDIGCYEVQNIYSRDVVAERYGTICLPHAVPAGAYTGAKIYKVVSFAEVEKENLLLEEVDAMEAGKPYFFYAEKERIQFIYTGEEALASNENGLYGTIDGEKVKGQGFYVLQKNVLRPTYNAATATDVEVQVGANRAYLKMDEVPLYTGVALSPRHRVMGVQGAPSVATDIDQVQSGEVQNTKLLIDGTLYILRGEKIYDITGKLIK